MALRTFTDEDGTTWNVWNVVPTLSHNERKLALSIGMAQGWLCFEAEGVKRRVVPTPEGWEDWSEEELATALAASRPVERRGVDSFANVAAREDAAADDENTG